MFLGGVAAEIAVLPDAGELFEFVGSDLVVGGVVVVLIEDAPVRPPVQKMRLGYFSSVHQRT